MTFVDHSRNKNNISHNSNSKKNLRSSSSTHNQIVIRLKLIRRDKINLSPKSNFLSKLRNGAKKA